MIMKNIIILGRVEYQVINGYWIYFYSGASVGDVRCATVSIYDDTKVENDEFFYFRIHGGSLTRVTESITRINILENDGSSNVLEM